MEPRWITAFVDQPAASFDQGTEFWASVTGSEVSARRGDRREFATLLPALGDACCRVQVTADDAAGIHLDFHVDSISWARREAEALGAAVVQDLGHVLMSSPGGLRFCLVARGDERDVPEPAGRPPSALDQICIDIPAALFAEEVGFWRRLLGWDDSPVGRDEFHRLAEPDGLPFHFLFQRLGDESTATRVTAHLDIAAGEGRDAVAAQHVALGATRVAAFDRWIVMRDPVGLEYCVTGRSPTTRRA